MSGMAEHKAVVAKVTGRVQGVGYRYAALRMAEKLRLQGWVRNAPDGSVETFCTVYIPTNHLYVGDVVVLPNDDVIETDLSIEDGISLILSAGASVPPAIGQRGADAKG